MKDMAAIVFRHITTILVVIALAWTIAKPHAEDFVRKTVNERITKIESQLARQEILLYRILHRLGLERNDKI